MASSPECITWMVVGLTESVTIIALNSLTVIAFFRDRSFMYMYVIIVYYYTHKQGYYYYAWGSFISIWLVVICVCYVSIFVKLRFGNQPRHHGAAYRERKLTITLFTVTSLSLLLWLPYVITTFLFFATNILSSLSEITLFRLELGSVILVYANCFSNPILYAMRMPGFLGEL